MLYRIAKCKNLRGKRRLIAVTKIWLIKMFNPQCTIVNAQLQDSNRKLLS